MVNCVQKNTVCEKNNYKFGTKALHIAISFTRRHEEFTHLHQARAHQQEHQAQVHQAQAHQREHQAQAHQREHQARAHQQEHQAQAQRQQWSARYHGRVEWTWVDADV